MEVDLGSDSRTVRAARNQALFRAVNEQLETLAKAFQVVSETSAFTCECADTACVEQMTLTMHEYEQVRQHANRFAVLPGHVVPDVERVVGEHDRFTVVEKIGEGARVAEASHMRAAGA